MISKIKALPAKDRVHLLFFWKKVPKSIYYGISLGPALMPISTNHIAGYKGSIIIQRCIYLIEQMLQILNMVKRMMRHNSREFAIGRPFVGIGFMKKKFTFEAQSFDSL